MEQKHTPYYYVDTQFGDRYCLMDGNDMSKKGAYRMLDEIKKVAELTKENEEAMQTITKQDVIHGNDVAELSKLHKEFTELAIKFEDKNFELSRLREREKELLEALRFLLGEVNIGPGKFLELSKERAKSLLSKFEAPNV